MITETSMEWRALTERRMGTQLRRVARVAALATIALAAAAEYAWRSVFHRGTFATRWRAAWQTKWARRALRALHLRLMFYGHAPGRGLLASNDAGPLGRLVVAAIGPTLFLSEPDAIEDAVVDDSVVMLPMKDGTIDSRVLERAIQRSWPIAPTWIQPMPASFWTLLSERKVPVTVAMARAENARGSVATLADSLASQVQLLAHATGRDLGFGSHRGHSPREDSAEARPAQRGRVGRHARTAATTEIGSSAP